MRTHAKDDLRVAEEAADWLLRLEQDHTAACHAEFVAWTKLSARHLHEFLFVKATAQEFNGIDPQKTIDLETLASDEPVVQLRTETPLARAKIRRRYRWLSAAAAVAGMAVLALLLQHSASEMETYTTAIGEQRSFKLSDGSLIHLNTGSRVNVHFFAGARDLTLIDGEAFFVVAPDTKRPFRVDAGATVVQAIGTQFNVYRQGTGATVSVIEGRVRISDKANGSIAEAGAGEQARIVSSQKLQKISLADPASALAWRGRRLIFRADPLDEVAEQFNRYNTVKIRIDGEGLRERRMSGVFDADDPQPLLRFLAQDPQLRLDTGNGEIVIRKR